MELDAEKCECEITHLRYAVCCIFGRIAFFTDGCAAQPLGPALSAGSACRAAEPTAVSVQGTSTAR